MVRHEFGRFFGWEADLPETLGFRLAANVPQTYEELRKRQPGLVNFRAVQEMR
jgi:hypothetical protein